MKPAWQRYQDAGGPALRYVRRVHIGRHYFWEYRFGAPPYLQINVVLTNRNRRWVHDEALRMLKEWRAADEKLG